MPPAPPTNPTPPTRNPGIDLIRGVSILLVILHHTALRIPLAKTALAQLLPTPLLNALSYDGYEAVFVFFVVSGFLITRNTITSWNPLSHLNPRAFYAKRAARILPCLLALVAALSLLDLLQIPDYTITRPDQSLPRAILAALAFHLNYYEGHTGYLPGGWDVLWSLSIEEVFYLAFPLICLTIGRCRPCLAALAAILALSLPFSLDALSQAPEIWREKAYLPGFAAIAMGAFAAIAISATPIPKTTTLRNSLGWLGTIGIVTLFWREDLAYKYLGNTTMLALTTSIALLMVAFHLGWASKFAKTKATAWLRAFGRLSYEIYLTHMFAIFPLVALFHRTGSNLPLGFLWFLPALALSWALGTALNRTLSTPANHWLRQKTQPHTPNTPTVTTATNGRVGFSPPPHHHPTTRRKAPPPKQLA
jgi:peptidoglycan/LPS O-acetylase OafA/YrhL